MNTPVNNLIVQKAGAVLSGLLVGNGTSPVSAAIADDVSAALDLIGATQGNVLYRNATGWVVLAPGTAGDALLSGGPSADVVWGSAGSGDVVGPASAVANRLATFDGTTGKLIQDASNITALAGTLTGTADIVIAAGGSNKSITFIPSGAGEIVFGNATTDVYARFASGGAANQGLFTFYSGASAIWSFGKQVDDTFILYSNAGTTYAQIVSTAGAMRWPAYTAGFLKTDGSGNITASAGGTGDVVGPGSSTDNAIVRFDGITGKLIQDSLVTISDLGEVVAPVFATVVGQEYIYSPIAGNMAYSARGPHLFYCDSNNNDGPTGKEFEVYTMAGTLRLSLDNSGLLQLTSYGAGILQSDASGNLTSGTLPAISTSAPVGSSIQPWKLGDIQAGAVAVDLTRSVFIDIAGTVYKLIVAT